MEKLRSLTVVEEEGHIRRYYGPASVDEALEVLGWWDGDHVPEEVAAKVAEEVHVPVSDVERVVVALRDLSD